jgi:hypothetical protein
MPDIRTNNTSKSSAQESTDVGDTADIAAQIVQQEEESKERGQDSPITLVAKESSVDAEHGNDGMQYCQSRHSHALD